MHKQILFFSLALTMSACLGYVMPYNPNIIWPGPINPNNYPNSIQDMEANLQAQQQQLQQQLTTVTQQLNALQQYSKAQKALKLSWIDAKDGQFPNDAVTIPLDNEKTIHICHTSFMHGTHPGVLTKVGCLITYGGYSLLEPTYQVLTGKVDTTWQAVNSMQDYQNPSQNSDLWQQQSVPIQGGFEKGGPLYICRMTYNNKVYAGKVVMDNCNFAYGAQEIYLKNFEVLFAKKTGLF